MPQLVANMKVNTQNKITCNLKIIVSKKRHAPYSNRYQLLGTINKHSLQG